VKSYQGNVHIGNVEMCIVTSAQSKNAARQRIEGIAKQYAALHGERGLVLRDSAPFVAAASTSTPLTADNEGDDLARRRLLRERQQRIFRS
jgi:hypothetical protein